MSRPEISVIVPTHNPDPNRLRRTLESLSRQTLAAERREIVVVDNASHPPLAAPDQIGAPAGTRCIREPAIGLTRARIAGFRSAQGDCLALVDDDNVLAADYLEQSLRIFAGHPRLGAAGGKSIPEFESQPAPWKREFFGLLALRDLGESEIVSVPQPRKPGVLTDYPRGAPIGAGMVLRREAAESWISQAEGNSARRVLDRTGTALVSGGDNDLVMTLFEAGWEVGYFPELILTHLIPDGRLESSYLARLNRSMQKSWMEVLNIHSANPWPPLTPAGAQLRKAKAWFTHRAWAGRASWIRWQGTCGHFDGRRVARGRGPHR